MNKKLLTLILAGAGVLLMLAGLICAKGWCFGVGLLALAASAVTVALAADEELGGLCVALAKRFGGAVKAGTTELAGVLAEKCHIELRKRTVCPNCGAKCASGARFCSRCGGQL